MVTKCAHKWKLDPPHNDQVHGVCEYCGEEATFPADGIGKKQVIRAGRPGKDKTDTNVYLEDLSPHVQQEILESLKAGATKAARKRGRTRTSSLVSKEDLVLATGRVICVISKFSLPQQRRILRFTEEVIEQANKRYWRCSKSNRDEKDGDSPEGKA